MNPVEAIVKISVGSPDISGRVVRYPVVPKKFVKYVVGTHSLEINLQPVCVCIYREIFNGYRWLQDPRFYSPMTSSTCGNVYVHDFVIFQVGSEYQQGRVNRFYCKVC